MKVRSRISTILVANHTSNPTQLTRAIGRDAGVHIARPLHEIRNHAMSHEMAVYVEGPMEHPGDLVHAPE